MRSALDSLRCSQSERLRALLAAVLEGNDFYRRKLAGLEGLDSIDAETLGRLPFTTKQELVADQEAHPPFGTNLTFDSDHYVRLHQTSGTTGNPLRWLDTAESWRWFRDCWAEILSDAGVQTDDRVFVAFSFGPFIGFWGAFEAAQQMGCLTLTGGALTTDQRLDSLLANEATVLVCTPTYALHLAETARRRGLDLSSSAMRLTIHAGEPGASIPNVRTRLEEAWGARCRDHAGATEIGAWGVAPESDGRMRLLEDHFIAEVIDPETAEPAPRSDEGTQTGELVLTNLGRIGSPVIRYRTGDLVERIPGDDMNPYSYLRGGVLARADDMVIVRGVNIYPSAIENLVRAFPEINEFRVTVETRDQMSDLGIEIEVVDGAAMSIVERLSTLVHTRLSLRPSVKVADSGSLPRFELKARRFVTD